MRIVFSLVGLLVVVAIVGLLAKKQLQAVQLAPGARGTLVQRFGPPSEVARQAARRQGSTEAGQSASDAQHPPLAHASCTTISSSHTPGKRFDSPSKVSNSKRIRTVWPA